MAQIVIARRPTPVRSLSTVMALGPRVDGALGRKVSVAGANRGGSRDGRVGCRGEWPQSSQVRVGRGCCEEGGLRVFHTRGKLGVRIWRVVVISPPFLGIQGREASVLILLVLSLPQRMQVGTDPPSTVTRSMVGLISCIKRSLSPQLWMTRSIRGWILPPMQPRA